MRRANFAVLVVLQVFLLNTIFFVPRAEAGIPILAILIPLAENLINKKAAEPTVQSSSECRVTANVEWCGQIYGCQQDLQHFVLGVKQGADVYFELVLVAKPGLTCVTGAKVASNWPEFREVLATRHPDERQRARCREPRSEVVNITDTGCIIKVHTAGLSFKCYTLTADLFFTNGKKQAGILGTDRVPYCDSTRTLVQLVVMSEQEITQRVNDPGVQNALGWSFGMAPTVPKVQPLNIPVVNPQVLPQELQQQPQAQYQAPPVTNYTPPTRTNREPPCGPRLRSLLQKYGDPQARSRDLCQGGAFNAPNGRCGLITYMVRRDGSFLAGFVRVTINGQIWHPEAPYRIMAPPSTVPADGGGWAATQEVYTNTVNGLPPYADVTVQYCEMSWRQNGNQVSYHIERVLRTASFKLGPEGSITIQPVLE
ncbi:MAG: hypothetical protein PHW65_02625 [Dehalococcoidales bacterium]|nr:hypothetical protein [Dehalococcoidales bacterium]